MEYKLIKYEEVKSKRNKEAIKLPQRGTEGSAGYDFFSPFDFTLEAGETIMIWTDVKAYMNPFHNFVLLIDVRSSMGKYPIRLDNTVGVIDSDYYNNESTEGNIGLKLTNLGTKPWVVKQDEAIAQGIFTNFFRVDDDVPVSTERTGGFGSTNKGGK